MLLAHFSTALLALSVWLTAPLAQAQQHVVFALTTNNSSAENASATVLKTPLAGALHVLRTSTSAIMFAINALETVQLVALEPDLAQHAPRRSH